MSASYPGSVKTFVTRNAGDVIQPSNVNDLQDEVNAIEVALLTDKLTVTSGQILFPAAQNASANANTLDDYEEGSWTPVLGGSGGTSGQTYGTQVGRYIKIGKMVMAWYDITLTAKGTITTSAQIQGLPFASDSSGTAPYVHSVLFVSLGTNWVNIMTSQQTSATVATLVGCQAAASGNNTNLTTTDITDTTTVRGVMMYQASA